MKKILLCLIITLLLATPLPDAEAVALKQYNGPEVIVRYEPPLENAAVGLAAVYPGIKADVEKKLSWRIGFVPVVVLIRRHDLFLKESRNDLVTAFAVPGENLIAIDYSRMERTPFELRSTLEHELCHLLLHRNIEDLFLPRWLDEGIAQWVGGGADILDPGEGDVLKQAVLSGNLLRLDDISLHFPGQPGALRLSYEESRSVVEFIVGKYGTGKLLSILEGLHDRKSMEQSVSENLRVGLSALERNWRDSLLRKYSWQTYLADHLYWILFFLAALGTVCGYLRLRKRIKNYRDEEDDDSLDKGGPNKDP